MRAKVDAKRKAVTKPVSLYPEQVHFLTRRSLDLGMSASRYVQKLIEHDRKNNLIARILRTEAVNAGK